MNLKLKLLLGTIYLICFSTLMFIIFSNFDFKDLTDVNFFKNNQQLLNDFKLENTFLLLLFFFLAMFSKLIRRYLICEYYRIPLVKVINTITFI